MAGFLNCRSWRG